MSRASELNFKVCTLVGGKQCPQGSWEGRVHAFISDTGTACTALMMAMHITVRRCCKTFEG